METILIIDDNKEFREFLVDTLLDKNFDVYDVGCPDDAYALLKTVPVDIILSDLDMPFTLGKEIFEYKYSYEVGVNTIKELVWVFPATPVIAMSALPRIIIEQLRGPLGTVPLLQKPFRIDDLVTIINKQVTLEASASVVQ